jgi:hypothetical protein
LTENALAEVHRDTVKGESWALFDDVDPGDRAVALVQARIDTFAKRPRRQFPAAVECLLTDRQALTEHLRFPAEHHNRIRRTNLIERTFGETHRRVEVTGRLPDETSCLTLVWAVLDRAAGGWRALTYTPAITRHLTERRGQLHQRPTPAVPGSTTETLAEAS